MVERLINGMIEMLKQVVYSFNVVHHWDRNHWQIKFQACLEEQEKSV